MSNVKTDNAPSIDEPIPPRPPQLQEAVRLANAAREQLLEAIEATEADSDLEMELQAAADDLESAIGYMTCVPEVGYLGMHVHQGQS
jgi:hypothetical protein